MNIRQKITTAISAAVRQDRPLQDFSEAIQLAADIRAELPKILQFESHCQDLLSAPGRVSLAWSQEVKTRHAVAQWEARRRSNMLAFIEVAGLVPQAREAAENDLVRAAAEDASAQNLYAEKTAAYQQRLPRRDVKRSELEALRAQIESIDLQARKLLQEATSTGDDAAIAAATAAFHESRSKARSVEDQATVAEVQLAEHERMLQVLLDEFNAATQAKAAALEKLKKARADVIALDMDEAALSFMLAMLRFGQQGANTGDVRLRDLCVLIGASRHLKALVPEDRLWVCDVDRPGVAANLIDQARPHHRNDLLFTEPDAPKVDQEDQAQSLIGVRVSYAER